MIIRDSVVSGRAVQLRASFDHPDTLVVKWWRIGPWDRQHDVDWEADGTITVFSNNQIAGREYSDIVAIDPESFETAKTLSKSIVEPFSAFA